MKTDLKGATEKYVRENKTVRINLTDSEKSGLEKLKRRQQASEIVVYQTDKSGKLTVDTPENYKEAARPHVESDEVVTVDDFNKAEKLVQAHTVFWLEMLNVGKKSGDSLRYKTSMTQENSKFPTMYTYRKDHKQYEDEVKGPPVRPLCDVSDSYSHKLSHFISNILKEVADKQATICDSTESMLTSIEEANSSGRVGPNTVVGSLDVKALYPSLNLDFTIPIVAEEFYESGVEIAGVDEEELGLYLSLNRSEVYLQRIGILPYCPRRRSRYGAPPKITGSGSKVKKEERFQPWVRANEKPDETMKRKMMKEALKIVIETIMKNHIYNFDETLRRQKEGGAIGMDLTGELAKVFMSWWDREMLRRLGERGMDIPLYERYVDDINIATEGVTNESNERESENDQEGDRERDERTFEIIREIGNEIHESIQLTMDVPSKNRDKKVPILDLKCWVGEVRNTGNGNSETKWVIMHEHYVKDVSSKAVIHRNSAISMRTKRTVLTQECLRIILNCSKHLEWSVTASHLSTYMARMEASGYDKAFRYQVLRSALNAYQARKEEAEEGTRPIYRKRTWNREERRKEKEEKRKKWYERGGTESVLFVTATPDSKLKNELQNEIDRNGYKIKVIEKSGTKVVRTLQRNDPFKKKECRNAATCMVCTGEKPGACRESGVTYEIKCRGRKEHEETGESEANEGREEGEEERCRDEYKGETSKNTFTRGKKHQEDLKAKRESSALWKHCAEKHGGRIQEFEMRVVDRVRDDAMKRQILEGIRIEQTSEETRMNGRSEWNGARVPRVTFDRS